MAAHRRAIAQWTDWMGNVDALLTPCIPFGAIPLDEVDEATTPMASFTRAGNYLGACGVSLPAGLGDNGLPIGMQLLGKPFDDAMMVKIGIAFQQATDWHLARPKLAKLGL